MTSDIFIPPDLNTAVTDDVPMPMEYIHEDADFAFASSDGVSLLPIYVPTASARHMSPRSVCGPQGSSVEDEDAEFLAACRARLATQLKHES